MNITPEAVKQLREKTQAGMMDCKKALQEAKGDMETAVEILRKKGMALAKKKEGRQAREGILGAFCNKTAAGFVEVNCETDFVINTEDFQNFVKQTARFVQEQSPANLEALQNWVREPLNALIAKIGENIQVRRMVRWQTAAPEQVLGFYLHAGSKIGVLVQITDPAKRADAQAAKEIAMHVAAMNPRFVRPADVPAEILEREKEILRAQVDAGKPQAIQEKIIEGKLKKFFADECLENQIFVKDPQGKKPVAEWLHAISPSARIEKFIRWQVGV